MFKLPEKHRQILVNPSVETWDDLIKENRKNAKRAKPWTAGCGHECSLFHPGVLFKEIVLSRFNTAGKANISCDTEIPKNKYFKFPENGAYKTVKYFDSQPGVPYCMINAFSSDGLSKIKRRVNGNRQSVRYFETALNLYSSAENLAELTTRTKEVFLQPFGFSLSQVYLSKLLETEMYEEFYRRIVDKKRQFIEIYNRGLEEMPYQTGIKRLDENELPFWKRKDIALPVPKAIPLSLFLGLYAFDLYIEGVGGSRYRPAADFIIKNYFKEPVPLTAVASATVWYGQSERENLTNNLRDVENTVRRMEENPQEFTDDIKNSEEIAGLIYKLNNTGVNGNIYRKIKEKKREIRRKIENKIIKKKDEIKKLKNMKKVISREYAFFIYPEEDLEFLFKVEV